MTDCNCSCSTFYEVCHNGCCCDNFSELDCVIANLKNQLFEKQQNVRDYCALESKFIQLQNDIKILCDQKKQLECELCLTGDQGNKLICGLKTQNENLKNELNEKNSLNKKLYGDNNNLFQALEGKTCDNQNLQDQMCHQEDILHRLNQDKISLQNTVLSLNQLRDKHLKDIQNLNTQINLLNQNSNDLDNTLRNKNCQNMQIINEFNNEKNLNNNLVCELKNKECALMQIQQKLCLANETLTRLENDLNVLNCSHNKNKEDIACLNNNLLNEATIKNQMENNNAKLNTIINDRNCLIQKLTAENNVLKCTNTNINGDNNFLNSKVEAYKKHILIITDQNEKLSAELEAIMSRDSQLLCTLGRDTHLRAIQQENKNVINSSLDCLKCFPPCNGSLNRSNSFGRSSNGNMRTSGSIGMSNSRKGSPSSLHNSRIGMGEEGQYSGGEEEMQYSAGEEGFGHSSGEEN